MDTKYYSHLAVFGGSAIFTSAVTSLIFGESNWQLLGSIIAGAVVSYLLHRKTNR